MKTPTNPPSPPPSQPLPWMRECVENLLNWTEFVWPQEPRTHGEVNDKFLAILQKHAPSPVAANGGLVATYNSDHMRHLITHALANHAGDSMQAQAEAVMQAIANMLTIPCQTAEESRVEAAQVAANNPAIHRRGEEKA